MRNLFETLIKSIKSSVLIKNWIIKRWIHPCKIKDALLKTVNKRINYKKE